MDYSPIPGTGSDLAYQASAFLGRVGLAAYLVGMVVFFHWWFVIVFVIAGGLLMGFVFFALHGQSMGAALAIFGVPLGIALAIVGLLLKPRHACDWDKWTIAVGRRHFDRWQRPADDAEQ